MKYFPLFILLFAIAGCSASKETVQQTMEEIRNQAKNTPSAYGFQLKDLRTQLSDAYAYRENEIPEGFNRIKQHQEVEKNLYEGYRIQIYSGQNVDEADTTAAHFRAWADTTIVGYQPNTYVFFRTPHYRVHVGDFHEHERAVQFSNIVKRYFKDAWVVYDKVNPQSVPADTTVIETK
jgi:hypothetical protein